MNSILISGSGSGWEAVHISAGRRAPSSSPLKEKDKTKIFPLDRDIEIKSIQSHDVDITEAPTGTRVGMRLKNVQAKDIERGFIISDKETVTTDYTLV